MPSSSPAVRLVAVVVSLAVAAAGGAAVSGDASVCAGRPAGTYCVGPVVAPFLKLNHTILTCPDGVRKACESGYYCDDGPSTGDPPGKAKCEVMMAAAAASGKVAGAGNDSGGSGKKSIAEILQSWASKKTKTNGTKSAAFAAAVLADAGLKALLFGAKAPNATQPGNHTPSPSTFFTVLAPDDDAVAAAGSVGDGVLRYHVLRGAWDPSAMLSFANGTASFSLTTLATSDDPSVPSQVLVSPSNDSSTLAVAFGGGDGSSANWENAAVLASNGVILQVDAVLTPLNRTGPSYAIFLAVCAVCIIAVVVAVLATRKWGRRNRRFSEDGGEPSSAYRNMEA